MDLTTILFILSLPLSY